jgi:N-acetyl-alpha-D-muramate 1-phosphate uridylyltransferase
MIPIAILCGGMATRMYPETEDKPKSLIHVGSDKDYLPFIKVQLDLLKLHGFNHVVLCVGKFGEQIEDYVNKRSYFGISIEFSYDGNRRILGTGGAIKKALPLLGREFFVIYGDSYCDFSYKNAYRMFKSAGKQGLLTIYHNMGLYCKSNVMYNGKEILRYNKESPDEQIQYTDYGVSIFRGNCFDNFDGVFDLSTVHKSLLDNHQLANYEVNKRFFEIGSQEGLEETKKHLCQL